MSQQTEGPAGAELPLILDRHGHPITIVEFKKKYRDGIYCSGGSIERSIALAEFLASGHELLHFIFYQFEIAGKLDRIIKIAREALSEPDSEGQSESNIADTGAGHMDTLKNFSRLWGQLVLSKSVDLYLVYVSRLLTDVFRSRPETLRTRAEISIEFVLQHDSMDDLVRSLADERVYKLAFKGIRELAKDFRAHLGVDLFSAENDLAQAADLVEARNIIVHNNGIISDTMASRSPIFAGKAGQRVDIKNALDRVNFLGYCALDVDHRVRQKFALALDSESSRPEYCDGFWH